MRCAQELRRERKIAIDLMAKEMTYPLPAEFERIPVQVIEPIEVRDTGNTSFPGVEATQSVNPLPLPEGRSLGLQATKDEASEKATVERPTSTKTAKALEVAQRAMASITISQKEYNVPKTSYEFEAAWKGMQEECTKVCISEHTLQSLSVDLVRQLSCCVLELFLGTISATDQAILVSEAV